MFATLIHKIKRIQQDPYLYTVNREKLDSEITFTTVKMKTRYAK